MTTAAADTTFTIDGIKGVLMYRFKTLTEMHSMDSGNLDVATVSWDALIINGIEYGEGYADVVAYRRFDGSGYGLIVDPEIPSLWNRNFTESARQKLIDGIRSELTGRYELPTLDELNAAARSEAQRLGYTAGIDYWGPNAAAYRNIPRDWAPIFETVTGVLTTQPYDMPVGDGIVTDTELQQIYLNAVMVGTQDALKKL